MKQIGVVSTSRADYSAFRPILRELTRVPDLEPVVFVSGTHLSPAHGMSVEEIEQDGFHIAGRVPLPLGSDSPEAVTAAMGRALEGFGSALTEHRVDLLLVLGDRFEMIGAALAAVPLLIPLAHVHGGELTHGSVDDSFRHALTKISHLHFAATEVYAQRIRQMGEEPWRVTVSGAPSLDEVRTLVPLTKEELASELGIPTESDFLLVTYHPPTLEPDETVSGVDELVAALGSFHGPIVVTAPNADTANLSIRATLEGFVSGRPDAVLVDNLGPLRYFSAMRHAAAMVGNSSSGLVEAASFDLPVVNIGHRQDGRIRSRNVIDVPAQRQAIASAITTAVSPGFADSLQGLENPYGDGHAAQRVVGVLDSVDLGEALLHKSFVDLPFAGAADQDPGGVR